MVLNVALWTVRSPYFAKARNCLAAIACSCIVRGRVVQSWLESQCVRELWSLPLLEHPKPLVMSKVKVENCYKRTTLRNSSKTSEMVENNAGNHPWKFQVLEKSGSQDMEPSRIWACLGSFRANPIFSSLVHGSDLIMHIMIAWHSLHDLGIVSLMFRIINYA